MKKFITISLALMVFLVAAYVLNTRGKVRSPEEAYKGRITQYSGVAMTVLNYYPSRHNGELPKSLEDPHLQEPVPWSYPKMKEQVAFNTIYLGRQKSSLTEKERQTPFIIEKEARADGLITACDYSGETQRLTPSDLDASDLTPEARAELAAILPQNP